MNEIRVLHVKKNLSADGATVVILNLAKQLKGRVVVDWLLFQKDTNEWHEHFTKLGSKIYVIESSKCPNRIKRFLVNYQRIKEFFLKYPYSIIHINTDGFTRWNLLLIAKKLGVQQRIVHSHNSKAEGGGIYNIPLIQKIGRRVYKDLATDYIACSKVAASWLFPSSIQTKVIILNNGIDTQRFRFKIENRITCRKELNIGNEFLIGHIGRFVVQKNHVFLIEVFQKIYEKDKDARLLLIGTGNQKPIIVQIIEEMGISSVVTLIDETSCPEHYYCAMDVFVLPSLHEGLSLSAVEAQCSGLPCFLSANCSEETVLTDNCQLIALEEGAEIWCDRILAYKNTHIESRKERFQDIINCGYDITSTAERLYKVYQK